MQEELCDRYKCCILVWDGAGFGFFSCPGHFLLHMEESRCCNLYKIQARNFTLKYGKEIPAWAKGKNQSLLVMLSKKSFTITVLLCSFISLQFCLTFINQNLLSGTLFCVSIWVASELKTEMCHKPHLTSLVAAQLNTSSAHISPQVPNSNSRISQAS